MSLRNQPYFPLYVQDYLTDEKLNECSAQSQGVYIKLMCLMHKSDEYGKILLKQKDKQNGKQINNFAYKLVKHLPFAEKIIIDSLTELIEEKVLYIDNDFLCQKRMIKDNALSIIRSEAGKKGGNKTQSKSNFAKAKSEANSENENEGEIENISKDEIQIKFKHLSLSKTDYQKLCDKYSIKLVDDIILKIQNYKKNTKYTSLYLTALSWLRKEQKPELTKFESLLADDFINQYYSMKEIEYYWTDKDSNSLKEVISKIEFTIKSKDFILNDKNIRASFQKIISSINDNWIKENLSLTIINSKYNEIISKIKNGKGSLRERTIEKMEKSFAENQ